MPTKVLNCKEVIEEFKLNFSEFGFSKCCESHYCSESNCLEAEIKGYCFKTTRLRNGWSACLCCKLRKEVARLKL